MSKKSKWRVILSLCLIGLSIAVIYLTYFEKDEEEKYISRAQAAKMLALLEHSAEECSGSSDNLPEDIPEKEWYAPYVGTAVADGLLVTEDNRFYPMKMMTYKDAVYVMQKLNIAPEHLSFEIDGHKLEDFIKESEWLEIYTLACGDKETMKVEDVFVVETSASGKDLEAWHCLTDIGILDFSGLQMERCLYKKIKAVICDNTVAAIAEIYDGEQVLKNVQLIKNSENGLEAVIGEKNVQIHLEADLEADIENTFGDIVFENGRVKKINLRQSENEKETESAGEGENEVKNDEAVSARGEAVSTIRVLLNKDGYSGYIHGGVQITGSEAFTMESAEGTESFEAGTAVDLTPADKYFQEGNVVFKTVSENGRIQILSLNRSQGHPSYRGKLTVSAKDGGLVLVNELGLEEYLYGVLPSEMPVSYGLEALKVQAVCARSFACKSVEDGGQFPEYGADVDDSTASQVYNNAEEAEIACQAVDETKGEVLYSGDEPVKAYFFSTSCGVTSDASDVWLSSADIPYLEAGLQDAVVVGSDGEAAVTAPDNAVPDLSDEDAFRNFINDTDLRDYYEKEISWFRWKVHLEPADIKTSIEEPVKLTVTQRGSSGVAKRLVVEGGNGETVVLEGEYNIRKALSTAGKTIECADGQTVMNQTMLPSGYFYVDKNGDGFDISGGGFGHGVGMSQNGVAKMCERGMDYETILSHYFKGTEIKKTAA